MTNSTDLSRRHFIGVAGGVLGVTAMASMPAFGAGPTENKPKITTDSFEVVNDETDVLVIGGGIAGVFAAVKAHDAGAKVTLVVKGKVGSSGLTPFGKGVFKSSMGSSGIDEMVEKVSASSLGTSNPYFTRQYIEGSVEINDQLKEWGFFKSPLAHKGLNVPIKARAINVVEHVMVTHLHKENGRVAGASGFSFRENKVHNFSAKTVILCTGSGGFKPNGFPMCDLTHDGTIMAYKIGAKITGKEWNDGHPGQAENSASCYDVWHGQVEENPSTTGTEMGVNHHLGVDMNYSAYVEGPSSAGGRPGSSSSTAGGPFVPAGFQDSGKARPSGGGGARPAGPPNGGDGGARVGGSTAGMSIHKAEGLVPVDGTGLTTIPGLYAAGDALGSYMSGGIYTVIGASMCSSAVQGSVSGEAAAKASQSVKQLTIPAKKLTQAKEEILAPLARSKGYSPAWVTQVLQTVMIPNFVLYIQKEKIMQAALAYMDELKEHHVPMLMADDLHKLRLAHETENMIVSAEMKMRASIMRTESRCSHYRLDYPEVDYENWQAWLNLWQDENGEMQFEKQPFGTWAKA